MGGRGRSALVRARQPRRQARAQAARARRPDHARAGGVAGAAGGASRRVPRATVARVPARARSATPCSTAGGSSSPTRACRSATRAAGRGGCASSRCTARRRGRPTSSACRSAAPGRPTTAARATVVYGHTPVPEPEWVNNTINIDTGCVFGGELTALRWPERELVSVPAAREYYAPARPFLRRARPTSARRTCSTSTTCRQADRRDAADAQRDRARGERRGRAGGDVALRDRSALARLSAADDGADRDVAARRTCSSTRPRRSPSSARRASRGWCARRSTWARGRSRSSAATRTSRGAVRRRRRAGAVYTRTGRPFFDDARPRPARSAARGGRPRPACGRRWRPTGSCWTASSCRGRRRRRS